MKSLSAKIISGIIAGCCVVALTLGLVFGLTDFSPKSKPEQTEQSTQGATSPINDSYWDEDVSRVDTNWAGSGTADDPWLITSAEELAGLSYTIYNNTKSEYLTNTSGSNTATSSRYYYYSGRYFKQTADIDVSAYWWQPIGIYYDRSGTQTLRYFSGNYDGDGYTVSGVFTKSGTKSTYSYQGLFGYVRGRSSSNNATISNLGVIDSYIQGYQYVGGVVGYNFYSIVRNCYNTGSVSGTGSYVGGVVGYNDSSSKVSNSYNTGSVSGSAYVGGVVGRNNSSSTVRNCYNTGSVSGSDCVGGVVGDNYSSSPVSNCYYGGECTLSKGIGVGIGTTTKIADLNTTSYAKNQVWYTNSSNWDSSYPWDFDNVWTIDAEYNDGYPIFKWQIPPTWIDEGDTNWVGDGTKENPYLIDTPAKLAGIGLAMENGEAPVTNGNYYFVDTYFKQTKDLSIYQRTDLLWDPIGGDKIFAGHYDGGKKAIILGKHELSNVTNAGIFGYVRGLDDAHKASIKNVNVAIGEIVGYGNVGIIVGRIHTAVMENCQAYSTCKTTGNGKNVGGLVGYASNTLFSKCKNGSVIYGYDNNVGGIAGTAYNSTFENCLNESVVRGSGIVGGICGGAGNVTVTNCYNRAERVYAEYDLVGGILGDVTASSIINCFNIGVVNYRGTRESGQIAGYIDSGSKIENSYFISGSATTTNAGGKITSSSEISDLTSLIKTYKFFAYGSDSSHQWNSTYPWNFTDVWDIYYSEGQPKYPALYTEGSTWIGGTRANTVWEGQGSQDNPYIIDTNAKLAGVALKVKNGETFEGKYFKQTKNIYLAGNKWYPIGLANAFDGTFDGNGYFISGLKINQTAKCNQGLFGYTGENAVLKNIKVADSIIESQGEQIGGIVGKAVGSTVENCTSNTEINLGNNVGGIAGVIENDASVDFCTNNGSIYATADVGGIVGLASGGTIQNCYNYGNIKTEGQKSYASRYARVGGIVGETRSSIESSNIHNVYIKKCITKSKLEGNNYSHIAIFVGATAGAYSTAITEISDCAGFGTIINNKSSLFVGYNVGSFVIKNSSFVGSTSNGISSLKPSNEGNTMTVESCYAISNGAGYYSAGTFEDFAIVPQLNDGCPIQKNLFFMASMSTESGTKVIDWFKANKITLKA